MTHVYVSDRSGFNFMVVMEDKKGKETRCRVAFEKGQFKTDDDDLAAAIDEAIADVLAIRRNVKKTDRAAAERLVHEHMAANRRTTGVKGGITAGAMRAGMDIEALTRRDKELAKQDVDPNAFAEDGLLLTEQNPQVDVGGDPKKTDTPAKPKINLGK